ncbi:MAG TPA: hypothetical protein PKH77_02460 [Anaerolineae bacterium]|nr:hypothetical protein [Anaerolineae bacterium]
MLPEEGGSWILVDVHSPGRQNCILDAGSIELASQTYGGNLLDDLRRDGFTPLSDQEGNWGGLILEDDVTPYTVPSPFMFIARFISEGTILAFDNGCMPTVEWHIRSGSVQVIDTFDNN